MNEKNTCATGGMLRPESMCGQIIVGGKFCGSSKPCEHKRPEIIEKDKFRPVHWSHIETGKVIGWGVERKKAGESRYKPIGIDGEVCPFKTEGEAKVKCKTLSAAAKQPGSME